MAIAHSSDLSSTGGAGQGGDNSRGEWVIEAMPPGLIDSPLEFLFAEHHRQREAASILTMLADGEFDAEGARNLLAFLETDFALHIGDEELALFPMLREHCLPQDKIEGILKRLEEEHREDETRLKEVVGIMNDAIAAGRVQERDKRRLRIFAEHICQHLALENGVLLPIARIRLGKDALQTLLEMLRERRL